MGAWYRTGAVAVTNGSAAVVGTGTSWTTQGSVGDIFVGPDGAQYEISAIADDTHLSIRKLDGTAAYAGATASAQPYAIIRNFTSTLPAQLASQLAAMMTAWHVTTDDWANWLAGSGTVTVHDSNGVAYTVATPAALSANYNGRLSKSVAGGTDVTLSSTEASNLFIELTGTLSANINVIVPASPRMYFIANLTSGAFTVKVKTASGTGIFVAQSGRAILECDGTNIINPGVAATGANSDITSLNALTSLTVAGAGNLPGYKNLVRNGSFRIWQRGVSVTPALGSLYAYTADGWVSYQTGAATVITRGTGYGNKHAASWSGVAGNTEVTMLQCIESMNVTHLNPAVVPSITLSAWIYSSVVKTITAFIDTANSADSFSTVTNRSLGSASHTGGGWQKLTLTYSGLHADVANGVRVRFNFQSCTSGTFGLSSVMLEEGSAGSAFEMPPYQIELAQCQRYYREIPLEGIAVSASGLKIISGSNLAMRVNPTFVPTGAIRRTSDGAERTFTGASVGGNSNAVYYLAGAFSTGLGAGEVYDSQSGSKIVVSAEL